MITNPVPALLCAPTSLIQTLYTTTELETALPYTGITGLIRAELDAAAGPVPLRKVVAAVTARSEVARASVYESAAKTPFTVRDGKVTWQSATVEKPNDSPVRGS